MGINPIGKAFYDLDTIFWSEIFGKGINGYCFNLAKQLFIIDLRNPNRIPIGEYCLDSQLWYNKIIPKKNELNKTIGARMYFICG